jgi:AcrR family transcriptional regulator
MAQATGSAAQQRRRAGERPDGKPARVTKRRGQTRARLLDAAFAVFAERGFGHVRIEDVCERAGFTRGAFYSNFDDLDELFFALYEERAQRVAGEVSRALREAGDLGGGALVKQVVDALTIDRDWALVRKDFLLHAARNPAVAATLTAHRDALRDAIAAPLRAAVNAGSLLPSIGSAEDMAQVVLTMYDGVTDQLLLDPSSDRLRAWLTSLITALLVPGSE